MKMKGPFRITKENIYYVPSKPGVFLLGDEQDRVLYVGKSDASLAQELGKALSTSGDKVTRFWYWDTWSHREANSLLSVLSQKYGAQSAPQSGAAVAY